ncbi:MAG: dihydrofolate reductase family protein [Kofleriaceae bacterium]
MTLDGRIATASGEARWITGPAARAEVHALRASHDAVLVGRGTVVADDPRLDVRDAPGTSPARVVVDSRLRMPATATMLATPGRTIVVGVAPVPPRRRRALERAGAEVWEVPGEGDGRVDLAALATALAAAGLTSVLVEGGGDVHAACLAAGLCDQLHLHVAPVALGGRRGGPAWLGGVEVPRLADARRFVIGATRLTADGDLVVTLAPAPRPPRRRRRTR